MSPRVVSSTLIKQKLFNVTSTKFKGQRFIFAHKDDFKGIDIKRKMEEQTVVLANGDHSVIIDEVEIKQVDVETSTVAELTGNRSMSAGDTSRECESVRMLEQLMQQHKTVYSGESLSKHFHGDILRVATKCWDQVNLSVHAALEAKFESVLDEFTVKEKLTELDKIWDESHSDELSWRPSGIPGADCAEAEGVVVRQEVIPRFHDESKQVHSISDGLQKVLSERQNTLKTLELEIQTLALELGEFVNALS